MELTKERKAQQLNRPVSEPIFSVEQQCCCWSNFKNLTDSED
nr:hypothetical protein [Synechocystis sp. PCC 7509]